MWLGERRHPGIQTSNSFFSLVSFLVFQKSCRTFWVPTFWLCWQSVDSGLVYQAQLFLSRAHGEFNDAWGIKWFSVCAFFWLLTFFFRTRHSAFGALDHIIWADLKKNQQWLSNFQASVPNTVLWWFCKPEVELGSPLPIPSTWE